MLPTFTPSSTIVTKGLDGASWAALEPLYRELLDRQVETADELERLIIDRGEVDAAATEAANLLYIRMSCQTDDPARAEAFREHQERVVPPMKHAAFELDKKIVEHPASNLLDRARYGVLLRDLSSSVGLFRAESVEIETKLALLGQEYSEICGAMTVGFRGEERTLPAMAKFQEEPDRELRESAWRAVIDRQLQDAERIEGVFEQMLKLRQQLAVNAGLATFREHAFRSRKRFDYTPETCHEFARGVREAVVPLAAKLMERRRSAMNVPELRPWDMQVDASGRPALKPFKSIDELVSGTARVFRQIDGPLGAMFDALAHDTTTSGLGCLDLASRKGKAPGGYQAMRDAERVPFIFMNAVGTQRDVEVLLHEGGHAFHSLLCRADPLYAYRSEIPIEFAEVASMSMEYFAHPHLGQFYSEPDSRRARIKHIEDAINLLIGVAVGDQFQHWLYTNIGHSRDARLQYWADLNAAYRPWIDVRGLDREIRQGWHRVLHFFEVPFYYIEYAIAGLGAMELWLRSKTDPAGAVAAYKRALSLGGSRPLPELFNAAGLSFEFGPAKLSRLMHEVERELDALSAS
jgi:oligoendopeptidase F